MAFDPSTARLSANEYVARVQCASEFVRSCLVSGGVCSSLSSVPSVLCVGVVLGSGLSDFTRLLLEPLTIDYADIPFMPRPAVSGHHGQLLIGRLPSPSFASSAAAEHRGDSEASGAVVCCFSGRVHSYEGHLSSSVCFITRLCAALGVRCMLYTNSAGGSGSGMVEGSVMLIVDHIRGCSLNVALDCCADERLGAAILDCSASPLVYSRSLQPIARAAASVCGVELHEGVYQWSCGPTYESHAEVRAGMRQNVSAFGMSTVPEVLAAASLGLPTMALSLCTNLAAGLSDEKLTHEAVKAVANLAGPRFTRLVHHIVHGLHDHFEQQPLTAAASLSPIDQPPATNTATSTTNSLTTTGDARVCRQLSLRPFVGWQPSVAELQWGARLLLDANVGHPPPIVVFQLPAAVIASADSPLPAFLAALLSSVRYVSLSDLPSLRQWPHSRTSLSGWLLLATERHSGGRIVLLSCAAVEGPTAAEAAYLVQLLSMIGARAFVQLADAVAAPSSSPSSTHRSFVAVCDVLDRSMDPPPPVTLPSLSSALSVARPLFDARLSECVERSLSSAGCRRGGVCSFGGPSFPSRSEQLIAAQAGCVGVGVAGVAPLLIASRLGLHTAAAWRLSPSAAAIHSDEDSFHSSSSWLVVLGGLLSAITAHMHGLISQPAPLPAATTESSITSLASSPLPASSLLPSTVSAGSAPSAYHCEQESWAAVSSEADRLLSFLRPASEAGVAFPSTALLLDASLAQLWPVETFKPFCSAVFSWPSSALSAIHERCTPEWTVEFGLMNGQSIKSTEISVTTNRRSKQQSTTTDMLYLTHAPFLLLSPCCVRRACCVGACQ